MIGKNIYLACNYFITNFKSIDYLKNFQTCNFYINGIEIKNSFKYENNFIEVAFKPFGEIIIDCKFKINLENGNGRLDYSTSSKNSKILLSADKINIDYQSSLGGFFETLFNSPVLIVLIDKNGYFAFHSVLSINGSPQKTEFKFR